MDATPGVLRHVYYITGFELKIHHQFVNYKVKM